MWDKCPILRAIDFVGCRSTYWISFFLPDPYQIPLLFLIFPTFSLFYLTTETQTLNAVTSIPQNIEDNTFLISDPTINLRLLLGCNTPNRTRDMSRARDCGCRLHIRHNRV
ncbi:hypothetical protein HanRHA438_Chr03g0138151 [Helianthus annuus]|nr:hypothetical protein HanHA300_Chr03g0105441 [Helianthus annuus]KAJ0602298.1 hypothetical protein HanIR_Chr03g0138071 [Helianthus annuus]KAJ0609188.1 hypothetical protein HanHA89_Chr03g0117141 [Helianthus annuus]KAJ0769260.1 hypothetical protein HanLR1_Chr03g0110731 [Helianthus annuus]KAJ0774995.1 hypothetical protein HanOQP8_Chr03g0118021 [Helianthus annuus]